MFLASPRKHSASHPTIECTLHPTTNESRVRQLIIKKVKQNELTVSACARAVAVSPLESSRSYRSPAIVFLSLDASSR